NWITRPLQSETPLPAATTAFTDAGRKSRKAVVVWYQDDQWYQHILTAAPDDSLQTLELLAVLWALANLNGPLNIVSDSVYVVGIVSRIEDASIRCTQNARLHHLLC
ncbi:PO113 protein, partial [Sylvietta virens]|nr:PO113 protein [Sylvietta virens]